jgi:hypothetical protein
MTVAAQAYGDELQKVRERLGQTTISDPALTVCLSGLARVEEVLRKPLRIVILGEYNSGKTSVAGLLIGEGLLPTSVVSNTSVPVLMSYAPAPALHGIDRNGTRIRIDSDDDDALTDLSYRALQVALPLDHLRDYQVLDTPSSSNPDLFVADADIVIWCTVATRAWTESERFAWSNLPKRCMRNAVLVATHKDSLQTAEECEQVSARLKQQTEGLFRSVVLANAGSGGSTAAEGEAGDGGTRLRDTIAGIAGAIFERRRLKAEKIVRRLSRLTLHEFASREVRPEAELLLASWDAHAHSVVDDLAAGRKSLPETIERLLTAYGACAEKLRPGVVTGDSVVPPNGRAVLAPMSWPPQRAAATRLVVILVADLTALLRMLAGTSVYAHPEMRADIQSVRSILLSLADLDGAFDALGKMLRT